jgi:virginiamycin B lyase
MPVEITVGHRAVWFTEISSNQIGSLNPMTGEITEIELPIPERTPFGITRGPRGVWFAQAGGDAIGLLEQGRKY